MTLEFIDPTEWWLQLPPPLSVAAQQQSQQYSTPERCWNAYLNQVGLETVLPWIRAEYAPEATAWLDPRHQAAVWEVVNGTAIVLGDIRLVLLPGETIDDAELEVPQEWVDIPSWAADYYFAVQVKLDPSQDRWVRVWSYTTHQTLKTEGEYDPIDRTYNLSRDSLNRDLSTFQATLQFCSQAQTRAAIDPLPSLPVGQGENLIQRLSRPVVVFPRLAVPFALWGALLEQPAWRQQLYQQRAQQRLSTGSNLPVQLSQWFQSQLAEGWQSIQSFWGTDAGQFAFGLRSNISESEVAQVKPIEIDASSQSLSVLLLVKLNTEAEERVGVTAQVYPSPDQSHVPSALTLSLLSDTGEMLQSVQAGEQDDYIQLRRFRCSVGTRFSLQVGWEAINVTEDFIL